MRILFALLVLLAIPLAARAADIEVVLKDARGQPAPDAVVTFTPSQGPGRAAHFPWPMVMAQHNIAFEPHVLIAPLGADISFPNQDTVRHHVYSFSPAKRFELKLYGHEQTRTVHFDKVGIVAVGCNIHDRMSGFIVVVDTPYAAKTDAAGRAVIAEAPDGPGVLAIWQEDLKAPGNAISRPLTVHGVMRQALTLDLRPHPAMKM
ncbi:MAG TPA: methylamine utilization protein [Caulobacteraceae bacterium]|jgi:plastocyanin